MKDSCGALLYTVVNGKVGLVLGFENGHWMPFKGCREKHETIEAAAIREIYEETGGYLTLKTINLALCYESARKNYYIGCAYVSRHVIETYNENVSRFRGCFAEKSCLRFFPLDQPMKYHHIVESVLKVYRPFLELMQRLIDYKGMICDQIPMKFMMSLERKKRSCPHLKT